jgi:hypothetical protein
VTMNVRFLITAALAASVALMCSCGDDSGGGTAGPNTPPTTSITEGPGEGSISLYRVGFGWGGTDPDGEVVAYDIAWYPGSYDTTLVDSVTWERTTAAKDSFKVQADKWPLGGDSTRAGRTHTFFVRAVDNDGGVDPEPAHRTFTAKTAVPKAYVQTPVHGSTQPGCVTFRWYGEDEDGKAVEFRYTYKPYEDLPTGQPYHPDDNRWSPWTTDKQITLGFGQQSDPDQVWSFYVQSKDNAGAIESTFVETRNHVTFFIDRSRDSRPWIKITCFRGECLSPHKEPIGARQLPDTLSMEIPLQVSILDTLCFRIEFQPGAYASDVTGIMYQLDDPVRPIWWDAVAPGQTETFYPPGTGAFLPGPGITTLYVWVKDDYCNFGVVARAYIRVLAQ